MIILISVIFILFLIWTYNMSKGNFDNIDNKVYSVLKFNNLFTYFLKFITSFASTKFWIIILLSVTFMKLSTIANISAYYYDIVAYCAMLVFLFSYAKAVASMGKPKILFVSGALFTSCALAATLPRIFMWEFLTLTAEDVAFSPLMVFAVLALALFAEESLGTMLNYDADAPVAAKEQANKDSDGETASEQAVDNVTEGVSENIEE